MKSQAQLLGQEIRKELKSRGISQPAFAWKLSVSEPTLKRWLRGEGVSLVDWLRMLDFLGLGLNEVVTRAAGTTTPVFSYTQRQEECLARTPGLLAFFDQLLQRRSPKQIAKSFKLPPKALAGYLSTLERIQLIEWLPGDRVKVMVVGEPVWIENGPLATRFRKEIVDGMIQVHGRDRQHFKVGVYSLGRKSALEIQHMVEEMFEKLRQLEIKDKHSGETVRKYVAMMGFGNVPLPLLEEIPGAGA